MRFFLLACLASCAFNRRGIDPPKNDLYFPTGVAVHASGRYAYVTSANFDLRYNAGTLTTIDLDALQLGDPFGEVYNKEAILQDQTRLIGNIGAAPVLSLDQKRLFVSTRERALLFRTELSDDGSEVSCGEGEPYDITFNCDGDHVTRLSGSIFSDELTLADTADPYVGATSKAFAGLDTELLYLTHLSAGAVTVYDISGGGFTPVSLMGADQLGISVNGTSAIAVASAPNRKAIVYAGASGTRTTQRTLSSALFYFEPRVALGEAGTAGAIQLYPLLGGGIASCDVKDMVLSPDQNRLYMVTRDPEALVTFDVSLDVEGNPRNRFIQAVPLDRQPAGVTYVHGPARDFVYVSSFQDSTLRVYDPASLVLLTKIDDVKSGPFQLTPARNGSWLLASYFNDDAVYVLDVSNTDATQHRFIARIGTPRGKK